MTPRTPQPGELLLLDGFAYRLGAAKAELDDQDQRFLVRIFERPAAGSDAEAAQFRANFNYKASGKCRDDELVWTTRADFADGLRSQALAVLRGNPRKALWAQAHIELAGELAQELLPAAGCWTLPGRWMLRTTQRENPATGAWEDVIPDKLAAAKRILRELLAHTFHLSAEG